MQSGSGASSSSGDSEEAEDASPSRNGKSKDQSKDVSKKQADAAGEKASSIEFGDALGIQLSNREGEGQEPKTNLSQRRNEPRTSITAAERGMAVSFEMLASHALMQQIPPHLLCCTLPKGGPLLE